MMQRTSMRSWFAARLPFVLACLACQCGGNGDGGGDGAGDDGSGSGGGSDTGVRAPGVPATWGEYCSEIGELVCQRMMDCDPATALDRCEIAFNPRLLCGGQRVSQQLRRGRLDRAARPLRR